MDCIIYYIIIYIILLYYIITFCTTDCLSRTQMAWGLLYYILYYMILYYLYIIYSRLLESDSDGMEVSYHAAGIICHILYDGHDLSKWARCDSPPQASANQDTTTHTPANQNVTLTPGSSAGVPMQQSNQEATASDNQIQVVAGFPMMDSMCSEDLMEASASQSVGRLLQQNSISNIILGQFLTCVWG